MRITQLGKRRVGILRPAPPAPSLRILGHLANTQEIPSGGEKPFAACGRIGHCLDTQIGNVAHINYAEPDIEAARHGTVQQTLHERNQIWSVVSYHVDLENNLPEFEVTSFTRTKVERAWHSAREQLENWNPEQARLRSA
jgi:hypothetical protein